MPTSPSTPAALPAAPNPDDRSTFNARAYPWAAALPQLSTDLTALAHNVFSNATEAAQSALSAAAQAQAATNLLNVPMWTAKTYALGDPVWSPSNGRSYRRRSAGVSAVDPANDAANWWDVSASGVNVVPINSDTTAARGVEYDIQSSLILYTPPSPSDGDWFAFINSSGTTTASIVGTAGVKVFNSTEPHNLNSIAARGRLVFRASANNWFYG